MLSQRLPDITRFSASSRYFPVTDCRPVNDRRPDRRPANTRLPGRHARQVRSATYFIYKLLTYWYNEV
jgi:hypothetical protein